MLLTVSPNVGCHFTVRPNVTRDVRAMSIANI